MVRPWTDRLPCAVFSLLDPLTLTYVQGDLDLFVPTVRHSVYDRHLTHAASKLYMNDGSGMFHDVTSVAAADVSNAYEVQSSSFGDVDGDGKLFSN